MRNDLLRTSALALAFVTSVGLAAAQQQPPAADPQQQSQQEKAQQTPSGQMGKEEPSACAERRPAGERGVRQRRPGGSGRAGQYRYGAGEVLREERGR